MLANTNSNENFGKNENVLNKLRPTIIQQKFPKSKAPLSKLTFRGKSLKDISAKLRFREQFKAIKKGEISKFRLGIGGYFSTKEIGKR